MTVKGHFERYEGTLDLQRNPAIELTIEAASLNTNNKTRDKHLRSDDFLISSPSTTTHTFASSPTAPRWTAHG